MRSGKVKGVMKNNIQNFIANITRKTRPVCQQLELPLLHDRIMCGTCHNPHEKGVLQAAAVQAAAKKALAEQVAAKMAAEQAAAKQKADAKKAAAERAVAKQ